MLGRLLRFSDNFRHRLRLCRWDHDAAWGRRAEDLAHRYLEEKGMVVVERNWFHSGRRGEADLIAWEGDRLVVVEVKSRRDSSHGNPERAMDRFKEMRVRGAARHFIRRYRIAEESVRFDLVTVVFEPFEIRHFPDAWSWRSS